MNVCGPGKSLKVMRVAAGFEVQSSSLHGLLYQHLPISNHCHSLSLLSSSSFIHSFMKCVVSFLCLFQTKKMCVISCAPINYKSEYISLQLMAE
ncbi:hypothetical protein AQUCO_02600395v1 [Aquilegia coerulea]|uniref:Uncharacterized protein n=1 Tax=Aquilegia coerulea TaxID=218851 RepID=A0A2G5D9M4_AQUCA|nr:hypothetical protein AQUCO_02600395v1 [Aquilegia coerulea]